MVHARISSLGWVVGGSETVIRALLDAIGPQGTLMVYVGWEDDPWHLAEWPDPWQQAYRSELPAFDAQLSEADHATGRLAEALVESPEKRWVTYGIPVWQGKGVVWKEVRDHDMSSRGAFPYERLVSPGQDAFEVIGTLRTPRRRDSPVPHRLSAGGRSPGTPGC